MKKVLFIAFIAIGIVSCKGNKNAYDASGTFEAIETIVSAEANGRIQSLEIEEGQTLKEGQMVG